MHWYDVLYEIVAVHVFTIDEILGFNVPVANHNFRWEHVLNTLIISDYLCENKSPCVMLTDQDGSFLTSIKNA